jgi:AcrR family transcriptional regulator
MRRNRTVNCSIERSVGQARSERTQQRLIEVAVGVFSELGYEAASTRVIAEQAQTSPISIFYYFGSKRGLYRAAAEFVGSIIAHLYQSACDAARQGLVSTALTHDQTLSLFIEFIAAITRAEGDAGTPNSWVRFIRRERVDPTEALEIVNTQYESAFEVGLEFISRLTKLPAEAAETRLQLLAVLSMSELLRTERGSVLRVMGWKVFGEEETRIVESTVRNNLRALYARKELLGDEN